MLRLLAVSASINRYLQTWSVNLVTVDRWFLVFGSLACFFLLVVASVEGGVVYWIAFVLTSTVLIFFLLAALHHNTIFVPVVAADSAEPVPEAELELGLFVSGKLSLWEGQTSRMDRILDRLMYGRRPAKWVYRVPCELVIDPQNSELFAVVADLDMSTRVFGIAVGKRAGMWSSAGTRTSVEQVVRGELLHWRSGEPAMRLVFRNSKGKRTRLFPHRS